MTYRTGEELFQEGDPADFLYVIVDGQIDIGSELLCPA